MLRLLLIACALACVGTPALAQAQARCVVTDKNPCSSFSGPWARHYQPGARPFAYRHARPRAVRLQRAKGRNIFRAYQAASSSVSCLTADTRAVLSRLEARVGKVSIVSTCRPGATIAGTGRPSFHRYGKAVDFSTRNKAAAIAFLRTQGVFVMTYCGMSHVHFNTGQHGASFCGSKARYASARKRSRRR